VRILLQTLSVLFVPEGGASAHVAASRRPSRERQSFNGDGGAKQSSFFFAAKFF
jgi:hypothetical protein